MSGWCWTRLGNTYVQDPSWLFAALFFISSQVKDKCYRQMHRLVCCLVTSFGTTVSAALIWQCSSWSLMQIMTITNQEKEKRSDKWRLEDTFACTLRFYFVPCFICQHSELRASDSVTVFLLSSISKRCERGSISLIFTFKTVTVLL